MQYIGKAPTIDEMLIAMSLMTAFATATAAQSALAVCMGCI
jgi:hypothetical protein